MPITSPPVSRAPDLVRTGSLDLAFHPEHSSGSAKGLRVLPFKEDHLVAITSADNPFLCTSPITLSALASRPFVDVVSERALRKVVDRAFHSMGAGRESRYEVSEIESLLQFVSGELGVAIVPSLFGRSAALSRNLRVLTLRMAKAPLPTWKLVLLTRSGKSTLLPEAPLALFMKALEDRPSRGRRHA